MKTIESVKKIAKLFVPYGLLVLYKRYRQYKESRYIDKNTLALIEEAVEKFNAQPWYIYAYKSFPARKHAFLAYKWIVKHIKHDAPILETGCGIGGILYFLAHKGWTNLAGHDIDANAIAAGLYVCSKIITGGGISLYTVNGFCPEKTLSVENKYSVILGINWIYHVPEYSLDLFLQKHINYLRKDGYFIFDMIDSVFNNMKNNMYCTQDWNKPETEQKRPSEYLIRHSPADVKIIAKKYELELVKMFDVSREIPQMLYVFKSNA